MLTFPARYSRWLPLLAGAVIIFLFLHLRHSGQGLYTPVIVTEPSTTPSNQTTNTNANTNLDIKSNITDFNPADSNPTSASCRPLPGIEDILVILKTGITEAQDKVPVHINTTLRCIPNKLIVSDYEEEISGLHTHDVFRNTTYTLLENLDFALYNRAKYQGRAGLSSEDVTKVANSAAGMIQNPGWKLDKWKFLPMAVEARNSNPTAKWYVILEADTYPIWPTLVAWLAQLDPTEKLYLGNQMQIGEDVFAHGGSGIILSNPAMHALADEYLLHMDEWHEKTNRHWAGDCIMGMALKAIGIQLTWAWPHVTGHSVWEQDAINEAFGKVQWCYPPVTFHHMTPVDIGRMFEFESEWHADGNPSYPLYSDVFRLLVRPTLVDVRENWENSAPQEVLKEGEDKTPFTHFECAEICAQKERCTQYRFDEAGTCKVSDYGLSGRPSPGVTSGSMLWRIDEKVRLLGQCESPMWIL
ncbi:hypothetical protein N7520_007816 [Penicillium odoratum]|uniref:uncharacterized protein n=1 Tax=Penicillium odoratum TaxID=1167516 RepID=UPI0025489A9B|nr:uncharacterized protein N7520_007816 [Penicillium odoratum]KAJ5760660.1 hypothetical protein N7520_007816 [Penicillium odoratum]